MTAGPGSSVVTGFRRFPGVADNPSQVVVEALAAAPGLLHDASECRLLEVAYAAMAPGVEAILADRPKALVMTGYSALAQGLKIERRASGRCSPEFPDVTGFRPAGPVTRATGVLESGPAVAALEAALRAEGLPCHLSDDAGAYVCNHLYYLALSHIAEQGLSTRAVFVHLPAIEGTHLAETSASAMRLDDMVRGVATVARVLARG